MPTNTIAKLTTAVYRRLNHAGTGPIMVWSGHRNPAADARA